MLRDALNPLMGNLKSCQHPGLLLDRYYPGNENEQKDGEAKTQHFKAMVECSKTNDLTNLYKLSFERWKKNLPTDNKKSGTLETVGRMVLGLGKASVLETGIHLHHHLGYPYIPGSSLKGICAHYCSKVWGQNNPDFKSIIDANKEKQSGQYHQFLFGDTTQAGAIGFEDAWWVPVPNTPFHNDIMTPHHTKWQEKGEVAPADYDSPIPVSFLSFSGSFHFCISWQGQFPTNENEKNEIKKWMDLAWKLLVEALTIQGVGGKTSGGYGLFDEEKYLNSKEQEGKDEIKKAQELKALAELEAMSPLQRSMKEFLNTHKDRQTATSQPYLLLYKELEKRSADSIFKSEEDRKSVAEEIKKGLQAAKKWTGKDSKPERTDFIKKILGEL